MTTPIQLETVDGLTLEAVIDEVEGAESALVICHPHPQMGGTMEAPLLLVLRDEMVERTWTVLRFNFRGIGASEGTSSTGLAEVADARAAVALARQRVPNVAIAGWSFGAVVAIRTACEDPGLTACVAIAPAVRERPGVTVGLPSPEGLRLEVPTLLVAGENDHLVEADDCEAWAKKAAVRCSRMAGANHFFWGKYPDLGPMVGRFLAEEA